jgi:hypothetical protein
MSTVRRLGARKYRFDGFNDPRRYITSKDCLTEPEVLQGYCEKNPNAVCLGGYAFLGCRPKDEKRKDLVKYDLAQKNYVRSDGKIVDHTQTYCGRKIPRHSWRGKDVLENRIWATSGVGIPDLIDGNMLIEAKGGLPSITKMHTALGQLLFYKQLGRMMRLGFLFPKIWLEAENLQHAFSVFEKHGISLLQV